MTRALGVAAVAALSLAAPAAAGLDSSTFRFERTLTAPSDAAVAFDADGPLFAHAGPELANLRILDAHGDQVPYRGAPATAAPARRVRVLNSGRQGAATVALLDLGPERAVRDQLLLEIPSTRFVGTVTVLGSDDRSTFTRLGSSRVFDIVGPNQHARSTVVAFAPTDFRYLQLRAKGIPPITAATVTGRRQRPTLVPLPAKTTIRNTARTTVVSLDLRYGSMPVDFVRVTAAAPTYDRAVRIGYGPTAAASQAAGYRVFRYYGTASQPIDVGARVRRVVVVVVNGDDPPLRGLRVQVLARQRRILVQGGHPAPLRVVYGGRPHPAPSYEFARLPLRATDVRRAVRGTLGPEHENGAFRAAPDTRSWVRRNPSVVTVALVAAALAVGTAGALALRRKA